MVYMAKQLHSGFARFPSHTERKQFVDAVLEADAGLKRRAYASGSQPTIVFEALSDSEYRKVKSAIEGLGRWFEDVQFEPMRRPSGDTE